jgi:DNA-binding transcriptional ArsR family regulator
MDAALKAIAEPNRRRILRLVSDHERSAGEIAAQFELSRPAVSQHLTVLKGAGLLDERRAGTRRLYSVRPEGLRDVRTFVEQFWDDRLDRLKLDAERGVTGGVR